MSAPADNTLERFGIPDEESDPEPAVQPRETPATEPAKLGERSNDRQYDPERDGEAVVETSPQYKCTVHCPACGRTIEGNGDAERHFIVAHDPTEFGLAPTGEGRKRSSDEIWGDQTPPWEAQR